MAKVNLLQLQELRQKISDSRDKEKTCITICGGTGCHAYGCMQIADAYDWRKATAALRARGVPTVVLTLGGRGACLASEGTFEHFAAFEVTPVDTTAAGDAFVGAFAVAIAEGRPLHEAVWWGNAAGALATTRLGAQPSLPSRDAVVTLLAHRG